MAEPKINPAFHSFELKKIDSEQTEEYKEYRRKWSENPRNYVVEEFPIHLDIESTTACNLKCPMCFQSFNPPEKGFIDFNLFKKVIDEGAEKGLCSCKLQYRGEPLLHPKIVEMVKYAKDKGILEVMFNTNATLLTEEMSRKLIGAGLDKIICSVDGYTKEFYESIRRGAIFEKTLENIKRFQKLKKEMGIDKPILRVQMVKLRNLKNPEEHIKKYIAFWGKIADHVAFEDENEWDYTKNTGNIICKEFICSQLWQRLFVMWNGEIRLCCGDLYGDLVLGNACKDSLSKVWTGEKMNKIRDLIKKGETHKIPTCIKCGFRRNIIKNILKKKGEGDQ